MNEVKVRICGEITSVYDQTVEIDIDEYERLDMMLKSDDGRKIYKAESCIVDWLDLRDVCDYGDFDLEDFEIIENDA